MKIYGDIKSGNCYKIKLICALLDISYEWVHMDILANETTSPSFLSINPNGKIPLLELDDGRLLSESNAIVNFLATGSPLLPLDSFDLAKVLQWQFFEQYSHEPYIAVARFITQYLRLPASHQAEYDSKKPRGYKALAVMEKQLTVSPYLVGKHLSTADISLYAYTHVAHEGGFDLENYPSILSWITNIADLPKYVGMND